LAGGRTRPGLLSFANVNLLLRHLLETVSGNPHLVLPGLKIGDPQLPCLGGLLLQPAIEKDSHPVFGGDNQ